MLTLNPIGRDTHEKKVVLRAIYLAIQEARKQILTSKLYLQILTDPIGWG